MRHGAHEYGGALPCLPQGQDTFALPSQQQALAAQSAGHFSSQISLLHFPPRDGEAFHVAVDQGERPDTTREVLARLKPAITPNGSVTAGKASGLNDGAATLVLCSEQMAQNLDVPVLARVNACAAAGSKPTKPLPCRPWQRAENWRETVTRDWQPCAQAGVRASPWHSSADTD